MHVASDRDGPDDECALGPVKPKRRCPLCGAWLSSHNRGVKCWPCLQREKAGTWGKARRARWCEKDLGIRQVRPGGERDRRRAEHQEKRP